MTYLETGGAYYRPETLSARAQAALAEEADRAISLLVEVELASAVAQKARSRELGRRDAHLVVAKFHSHLQQGIYARLPLEAAHFSQAREWLESLTVPLRTLDALQVAVAAMNGCSSLTSDVALARPCTKLGVSVRLVR